VNYQKRLSHAIGLVAYIVLLITIVVSLMFTFCCL
jgi:hypothetical protein